ncbi:Formate dehydrogenase accessory protein FdhE [Gammaproteobacteria bacterium]
MQEGNGRLLLTLADPWQVPEDLSGLINGLAQIGLIGARLSDETDDGTAWSMGDRFLTLVTFLGCSPFVRIEPSSPGSRAFCHVRSLGPWRMPRAWISRLAGAPRCPACRTRYPSTISDLDSDPATSLNCPCGLIAPLWQWDFKDRGGFGRWSLSLEDIFPNEALPGDELMAFLMERTGSSWRFFYLPPGSPS